MELAKYIRKIKSELIDASIEAEINPAEPQFVLKEVELDLEIVATESREVEEGLDFQVVNIGGNKSVENSQVQKVKVTMTSKDALYLGKND